MMLAGIIQLRKPDVVCPVSDEAAVCVRARTCVCVCVLHYLIIICLILYLPFCG